MIDTTTLVTAPQDELRFRLSAERTVSLASARVGVTISALVTAAEAEPGPLRTQLLERLGRFIAADWSFSLTQRAGDATGYERVSARAYARVPAAELYALENRARAAAGEGFALGKIEVDYSLPAEEVATVVRELRLDLYREALAEAGAYSALGRAWRIGAIEFGIDSDLARHRSSKGALLAAGEEAEAGAAGAAAEKIKLVAEVVLRA